MRQIKFRAWDKTRERLRNVIELTWTSGGCYVTLMGFDTYMLDEIELMQYTGLKDKNGVEIYEYSELDGAYEVIFKDLRYSLRHIPNNDIIDLHDYWRDKNGEIEVTREYTKV